MDRPARSLASVVEEFETRGFIVLEKLVTETPAEVCSVGCGGALVMRPLVLHASSAATAPTHRRVIHIEYSPVELPDGLQWQEA